MRNSNKTRIIALAVFSMLLLGLGSAFASSAAFNRMNIASSPYFWHGPITCRPALPIIKIENNILLFEHGSKSIGPYKVVLYNLTFPSINGTSKAVFNIYYNNKFVGSAIMLPGQTYISTHVSDGNGNMLVIKVDETFPGLYINQRWAKINLVYAQRPICIMQPV